jgi:hypothetical protein
MKTSDPKGASEKPSALKKPHWSASRFMLFEQCPRLYKERYIDGVTSPPSLAMLFGHTVHTALEAMHQGHRGTRPVLFEHEDDEDRYGVGRAVYQAGFQALEAQLEAAGNGAIAPASLYLEGLKMLDQVAGLRLNDDGLSEPERWFVLPTTDTLGMPTVGAVDLWSPPWSRHGPTVWDFKTTVGSWSAERANRERWQPMLYARAFERAYGVVPTFRYLVLSRLGDAPASFDRSWSPKDWIADLRDLQFHAEEIAERVRSADFACTRGHGTCLECGKPYGHDHVCPEGSRPIKAKLVRKHGQTWVQPAFDLA